jgi:hypothetical protein
MPRVICLGCGHRFTGKWFRKFCTHRCFAKWYGRQRREERLEVVIGTVPHPNATEAFRDLERHR